MAVFTPLSEHEIRQFLASYALAPLQKAEGIRTGIENTNYLLVLEDDRKLILTLFEGRVNVQDVPYFTGLMEHLAGRGFPAPMPLHAEDGSVIRAVKGKSAIIVTFLEGRDADDISMKKMGELGAATARLHLAARGYDAARPNSMSFAAWKALLEKTAPRANEICAGLAMEMRGELAAVEALWPRDLPQGVIHADLFPDNVFFNEQQEMTGVIDFYFACNDALAYELAICINAWCFDREFRFEPEKSQALLQRYHALRPLSQAERGALPVLARAAALRFLLTRTHDWLFRP